MGGWLVALLVVVSGGADVCECEEAWLAADDAMPLVAGGAEEEADGAERFDCDELEGVMDWLLDLRVEPTNLRNLLFIGPLETYSAAAAKGRRGLANYSGRLEGAMAAMQLRESECG